MPIAASTKIVAAVVIPTRPPASRKIAPAPKKPMPWTILDAMRVLPVSPKSRAISLERMVNSAVARQTNRLVRMPAGRRRRSRSMPMIAPSTAATVKRRKISRSESMAPSSQRSPVRDFTGLQFELRQFREVPCSGVYLFLFQVSQAVQPEFLNRKAAQHGAINHRPPQRSIIRVFASGEIAHESTSEAVTCSCGIVRFFQRKRGHAKHSALVHHHCAVFSALHHQDARPHLENVLSGAQQVVLARKLTRL